MQLNAGAKKTLKNIPLASQKNKQTNESKLAGGEAFAPLLNYMYTGRLEVTLDNVYSVLLATHLLHMPGALEQCRAALLRLRAPPPLPTPIPVPAGPTSTLTSTPPTGNILRPIPSRLMIDPTICWPPTAPLYPPSAPPSASIGIPHLSQLQPSVLMQSTVPLGVSAVPSSSVQQTHTSTVYRFGSFDFFQTCVYTLLTHERTFWRYKCDEIRIYSCTTNNARIMVLKRNLDFISF